MVYQIVPMKTLLLIGTFCALTTLAHADGNFVQLRNGQWVWREDSPTLQALKDAQDQAEWDQLMAEQRDQEIMDKLEELEDKLDGQAAEQQ